MIIDQKQILIVATTACLDQCFILIFNLQYFTVVVEDVAVCVESMDVVLQRQKEKNMNRENKDMR